MKNEYKITRDLMMSWSKNIFGTTTIVFLIFYSIIILMSVGLLVLLALIRSNNWKLWAMSLFILVFSSYRVFFLRYYFFAKKYKILSKTYGVTEWIRTTEFNDDEIVLTDHNSVCKFKYENIKRINEKGNSVIIYFNDNLSARLYKDAFVDGTWEECKAKINALSKITAT
jgi:hypothetical protein